MRGYKEKKVENEGLYTIVCKKCGDTVTFEYCDLCDGYHPTRLCKCPVWGYNTTKEIQGEKDVGK